MKFRKKPIVIEAIQFTGTNFNEVVEFAKGFVLDGGGEDLVVATIEGPLHASQGDWIIKGVAGEFYPCKPDIFQLTYDKVPETDEPL